MFRHIVAASLCNPDYCQFAVSLCWDASPDPGSQFYDSDMPDLNSPTEVETHARKHLACLQGALSD
eukprot:741786-Pyramimonas_sp.AAC.1